MSELHVEIDRAARDAIARVNQMYSDDVIPTSAKEEPDFAVALAMDDLDTLDTDMSVRTMTAQVVRHYL